MLLMTFATKPLSSASAGFTRLAIRGAATLTTVVKAVLHRREVMRLGELDERGLKDIGLVRSDVAGALATSWLNDPSVILAARSSARSGVALARREEGLRQADLRPAPSRHETAVPTHSVACSA